MKGERKTIDVDGVFDIETENWDTFVCGGLLKRTGGTWKSSVKFFHDEESLVDEILCFSGTIWAHNGGRYDTLWLANKIVARGIHAEINLAGQRIVRLKCGNLEVRDSYALIPFALKLAAEMGGGRKEETQLECVCMQDCGGYCSISRNMKQSDKDKLVTYLRTDLLVTRDMLLALKQFAEDNDIDLCATIGSSAYATIARKLGIPAAKWSNEDYNFIREGYYGGRTQVFRCEAEAGYRIDVNSAYIAALSKLSVPTGQRYKTVNHDATRRAFDSGDDGIVQAKVLVSYQHIPPLPKRTKQRLAYLTGEFIGTWTTIELRYAVNECGVRVLNFGDGIFWETRQNIFGDFEAEIWDLRAKVGTKTAFGQWLKWFANSQTGKFAQHPLVDVIEINPDLSEDEIFCHCKRECNCNLWQELDRNGKIWTKKKWRVADCAHIHWAAFLTAYQRIYLHQQLVDDGEGGLTAVYCDTDSVYSTRARAKNIGNNLGEWKDEGPFKEFRALAPKTYRYLDENGNAEARAKGIPDAVLNWQAMQSEFGVSISRGVDSFRHAARTREHGLFIRKLLTRHCFGRKGWYGDRKLATLGGVTRPVTLAELEDGLDDDGMPEETFEKL